MSPSKLVSSSRGRTRRAAPPLHRSIDHVCNGYLRDRRRSCYLQFGIFEGSMLKCQLEGRGPVSRTFSHEVKRMVSIDRALGIAVCVGGEDSTPLSPPEDRSVTSCIVTSEDSEALTVLVRSVDESLSTPSDRLQRRSRRHGPDRSPAQPRALRSRPTHLTATQLRRYTTRVVSTLMQVLTVHTTTSVVLSLRSHDSANSSSLLTSNPNLEEACQSRVTAADVVRALTSPHRAPANLDA